MLRAMSDAHLFGLSYSPWSLKARWALDHHRVPFRWHEYLPMLGAPLLRLRTHRLKGRLTVPVFVDDSGTYTDSFDIARRAEAIGGGARLFPDVDAVRTWNEQAEALSAAGRALATPRVAADPEARHENVPPAIPKALRGLATPLVDVGSAFLARKYRLREVSAEEAEARMAEVLADARAALAKAPYLLGEFSYADMTLAMALQFVQPVGDAYVRLGPGSRRAWTRERLAGEFGDVLAWRDRVVAEYWARPR
jgi:glutathione S-transferase